MSVYLFTIVAKNDCNMEAYIYAAMNAFGMSFLWQSLTIGQAPLCQQGRPTVM